MKHNRSPSEVQQFYASLAEGSILRTCCEVWGKLRDASTLEGAGIYTATPFIPGTALPQLYLACQDDRVGDLAELCLKLVGNRLLRTMWCWAGPVPGCFALLGGNSSQQALGLDLLKRMDAAYHACLDNTHREQGDRHHGKAIAIAVGFPKTCVPLVASRWLGSGS